jgi:hypothetical protein
VTKGVSPYSCLCRCGALRNDGSSSVPKRLAKPNIEPNQITEPNHIWAKSNNEPILSQIIDWAKSNNEPIHCAKPKIDQSQIMNQTKNWAKSNNDPVHLSIPNIESNSHQNFREFSFLFLYSIWGMLCEPLYSYLCRCCGQINDVSSNSCAKTSHSLAKPNIEPISRHNFEDCLVVIIFYFEGCCVTMRASLYSYLCRCRGLRNDGSFSKLFRHRSTTTTLWKRGREAIEEKMIIRKKNLNDF